MKYLLFFFLSFVNWSVDAQKYVLIDEKMAAPVSFTNVVTVENSYKNLFAVEKDKVHQFVGELEKISAILADKKNKPGAFDVYIGKTRFVGLKIPLATEDRLDVVLTTDCDGTKVTMHLSDAKISNASNAFFINTWVKYIKSYLK